MKYQKCFQSAQEIAETTAKFFKGAMKIMAIRFSTNNNKLGFKLIFPNSKYTIIYNNNFAVAE